MTTKRALIRSLRALIRSLPNAWLNHADNLLFEDRLRRKILSLTREHVVRVVYDIGANKGEWSTQVAEWLPGAKFVLFEANAIHEPLLAARGFDYAIALLSSDFEPKAFFQIGGTGDSYLKELSHHYEGVTPVRRDSQPLDYLVESRGFPLPDFVKIDTQGSELDVIKGGEQTLRNATFMLLECPVQEINQGAPDLADYMATLKNLGFKPSSIVEHHESNGELFQVDILFVADRIL